MKGTAFLFAVVMCGVISALGQTSEKDAVRVPLENYIKGHATGDAEYMKKAFHTDGNLIFVRDGKYTTRAFAEYIGGFTTPKTAPDEDKRKRLIESIDVAGNAASAKIILDYPNVKFVDYMSLLNINGEWKIVNKIFYAEPKQQSAEAKKGQ